MATTPRAHRLVVLLLMAGASLGCRSTTRETAPPHPIAGDAEAPEAPLSGSPVAELSTERLLAWQIPSAFDLDVAAMSPFTLHVAEEPWTVHIARRHGPSEVWRLRQIPGRFDALLDLDRVYVIDETSGSTRAEEIGVVAASRNGQHLAFARQSAAAWQLALAHHEAGPEAGAGDSFRVVAEARDRFAGLDWPAVSPDGRLVAAWGIVSTSPVFSVVVLYERQDGDLVERQRIDSGFVKAWPVFSPFGEKLAFRAILRNGHEAVIVDGEMGEAYDAVGFPVFSPDGRRIAYHARRGGESFLVVNEQRLGPYDQVGTPFFLASERLAYVAREGRAVWWKVQSVN